MSVTTTIGKRYEIRDVETGEKLSGVSFMLTPTGEEMHVLCEPTQVSSIMAGVYYTGNIADGPGPPEQLNEIIPEVARWAVANKLIGEMTKQDYLQQLRAVIDKRLNT